MIPVVLSSLLAAQAPTPTPTPPPAEASAAQSQIVVVGRRRTADPIVCHTIVITGSRIPEAHQCQRESQWEQERRRNQDIIWRQVSESNDYNQQRLMHDSGP